MDRIDQEKKCTDNRVKRSKTLSKKCESFKGAYPLKDFMIRFSVDINPNITFASVIKAEDVLSTSRLRNYTISFRDLKSIYPKPQRIHPFNIHFRTRYLGTPFGKIKAADYHRQHGQYGPERGRRIEISQETKKDDYDANGPDLLHALDMAADPRYTPLVTANLVIDLNKMAESLKHTGEYYSGYLRPFTYIIEPRVYIRGPIYRIEYTPESIIEYHNKTINALPMAREIMNLTILPEMKSATREVIRLGNDDLNISCYKSEKDHREHQPRAFADYITVDHKVCRSISIFKATAEEVDGLRWEKSNHDDLGYGKQDIIVAKRLSYSNSVVKKAQKQEECGVPLVLYSNRVFLCQKIDSEPVKTYFRIIGNDAKIISVPNITYKIMVKNTYLRLKGGRLLYVCGYNQLTMGYSTCYIFEIIKSMPQLACDPLEPLEKYRACMVKARQDFMRKFNLEKFNTTAVRLFGQWNTDIIEVYKLPVNKSHMAPLLLTQPGKNDVEPTSDSEIRIKEVNKDTNSDIYKNIDAFKKYFIGTAKIDFNPPSNIELVLEGFVGYKSGYEDLVKSVVWKVLKSKIERRIILTNLKDPIFNYIKFDLNVVTETVNLMRDASDSMGLVLNFVNGHDVYLSLTWDMLVNSKKIYIPLSEVGIKLLTNNFYGIKPDSTPVPELTNKNYVTIRNYPNWNATVGIDGFLQAYDLRPKAFFQKSKGDYNKFVTGDIDGVNYDNYDLGLGQLFKGQADIFQRSVSDYYKNSISPFTTVKVPKTKNLRVFDMTYNFTTPNEFRVFMVDYYLNLYALPLSPTIDIKINTIFLASSYMRIFVMS